jgi:hypothetical protein
LPSIFFKRFRGVYHWKIEAKLKHCFASARSRTRPKKAEKNRTEACPKLTSVLIPLPEKCIAFLASSRLFAAIKTRHPISAHSGGFDRLSGQWFIALRSALLLLLLAPLSGCAIDAIQLGYDMEEKRMTLTMPIRSTQGYKK